MFHKAAPWPSIYIKDLPEVVLSSKVLLFADDAKYSKSIFNFSDCMTVSARWSKETSSMEHYLVYYKILENALGIDAISASLPR